MRVNAGSGGSSDGSDPFDNPSPSSGIPGGNPAPGAIPPAGTPGTGAAGGMGTVTGGGENCDTELKLVVRDFTEAHPDFESFMGNGLEGIVESDLGSDQKPVYAHPGGTAHTTGPGEFDQWYRDVDGVNQRVEVSISFTEASPGVYVYDNDAFFPIDGQGLGNGPQPEHNYLFTTEAHTRFTYRGGETFTFRGDDDLWVFVNGKLAVDLGGLHQRLERTIDFDAAAASLGLQVGETYAMDIFHAERHTSESNFRIETSIDLSCIENIRVD